MVLGYHTGAVRQVADWDKEFACPLRGIARARRGGSGLLPHEDPGSTTWFTPAAALRAGSLPRPLQEPCSPRCSGSGALLSLLARFPVASTTRGPDGSPQP